MKQHRSLLLGFNRQARSGGFTLIEIMVVIAIIVILVGMVIAVGSAVKSHAQIDQTKTTLKNLQALISTYQLDVGSYPSGAGLPGLSVVGATGNTSIGSTTISSMSTTTNIVPGMLASGFGIPTGTLVTAVTATSVTLNLSATAAGTGVTVTFDALAGCIVTLRAYPATNAALARLNSSIYTQVANGNWVVMDGFGSEIRYEHNGASAPYFVSNGPDGIVGSLVGGSPSNPGDDIFSYDP